MTYPTLKSLVVSALRPSRETTLQTKRNYPNSISIVVHRAILLTVIGLPMTNVAHSDEFLIDGDFDDLAVGTAPDNGVAAGGWEIALFGAPHQDEVERIPGQLTIVESASFDAEATGNALRIETPGRKPNLFMSHEFTERIQQTPGQLVRASFDVYIPGSGQEKRGGFAVYLGGDHGGDIASRPDRGPMVGWSALGGLYGGNSIPIRPEPHEDFVVESTPVNAWQTVQLDVDLARDTFDMFWAAGGQTPELVASSLPFNSPQSRLDRFVVALWPGDPNPALTNAYSPEGVSYLDNVSVEVIQSAAGDADMDGDVDFTDFLTLSENFGERVGRVTGWGLGDFDGDREVGFSDFLALSANYGGAANASASSVPEPTAGSIALISLLGLIGFRKRR